MKDTYTSWKKINFTLKHLGYIKENKIPIEAQIVSIAAEYNNLLKVMNESSVLEDIIKKSGTRFNPNLVESLKNCVEEIKKVNETM